MALRVVDLPVPLPPRSATRPAFGTFKLSPWRIRVRPYPATRFSTMSTALPSAADVGFHDSWVFHHEVRFALSYLHSGIEDDDAIAQAAHDPHHVFDEKDRHAKFVAHATDEIDESVDVR